MSRSDRGGARREPEPLTRFGGSSPWNGEQIRTPSYRNRWRHPLREFLPPSKREMSRSDRGGSPADGPVSQDNTAAHTTPPTQPIPTTIRTYVHLQEQGAPPPMPNPYHFRARIDRLWRRANSSLTPATSGSRPLDAVAREIYPATDRTRQNLKMYLATDPYEVARHKLRHLARPTLSLTPSPLGEGRGEGSPAQLELAPADLKVAPAKAGARDEGSPPRRRRRPLAHRHRNLSFSPRFFSRRP